MTLTKIANEQRFSFDHQPNAETAAVLEAVQHGREPMNRPDLVLIHRQTSRSLELIRMGSHATLFG